MRPWLALALILVPAQALADSTTTTETQDYTEWLFRDTLTFSAVTSATSTNRTFTVRSPTGWTTSQVETTVVINYDFDASQTGIGATLTTWTIDFYFDNHYLTGNASLSARSGPTSNCASTTLTVGPTTSVVGRGGAFHCALDRQSVTSGTHGIYARATRATGTSTLSSAIVRFDASLIQHYEVNYVQPGSSDQFNRIEKNVNSAWGTGNSTRSLVLTTLANVNSTLTQATNAASYAQSARSLILANLGISNSTRTLVLTGMPTLNQTLSQAANATSYAQSARSFALQLLGISNSTRAFILLGFPTWNLTKTAADNAYTYAGRALTAAQAASTTANNTFGSRVRHTGDWNASRPYKVGDIVTFDGTVYMAINNNTGAPPATSTYIDSVAGYPLSVQDTVTAVNGSGKYEDGINTTQGWLLLNNSVFRDTGDYSAFARIHVDALPPVGISQTIWEVSGDDPPAGEAQRVISRFFITNAGQVGVTWESTVFGQTSATNGVSNVIVAGNDYSVTLQRYTVANGTCSIGTAPCLNYRISLNGSVVMNVTAGNHSTTAGSGASLRVANSTAGPTEPFQGRIYEFRWWNGRADFTPLARIADPADSFAQGAIANNETAVWFFDNRTDSNWGVLHDPATAPDVDLSPVTNILNRIEPNLQGARSTVNNTALSVARVEANTNLDFAVDNATLALLGRVGNNVAGARATLNHTDSNMNSYRLQFNATDFGGNATNGTFWSNLTAWHKLVQLDENVTTVIALLPTVGGLSADVTLPGLDAEASLAALLFLFAMLWCLRKGYLFPAGAALVGSLTMLVDVGPFAFLGSILLLILAVWMEAIVSGLKLSKQGDKTDGQP